MTIVSTISTLARKPQAELKAQVNALNFYYGDFQALKGIDFPVEKNQVTALIGPSGCGKSTFLRCFNRMHDLYPGHRYDGSIRLHPDEVDLLHKSVDPIEVRMRISMVFQKPNPFPKSIFENVAYGLKVRGERNRTARLRRARLCRRAQGQRAVERGQGPPGRTGGQSFWRPAAAPVHCTRTGHRPRDHPL